MNDGGPAFPATAVLGKLKDRPGYEEIVTAWPAGMKGMSLRDWFAGQALIGISSERPPKDWDDKRVAAWCYKMADAMLKERG